MSWAIKHEYFEKVYGKSHKPKDGTSERGIRQEAFVTTLDGIWKLTIHRSGGETIYSFTKFPPQLQGQLHIEEVSTLIKNIE